MKIKRLLSIFLSVVILSGVLSVSTGASSIFDSAIEAVNETVKTRLNYYDSAVYKVNLTEDGKLSIKYSAEMANAELYVFNSDGALLTLGDIDVICGSAYESSSCSYVIRWDRIIGMAKGVLDYDVPAGEYYIKFVRDPSNYIGRADSDYDDGTLSLTFDFPGKKKSEITRLQLTMSQDSSIQLGAVLSIKTSQKVDWQSYDPSIVTVSSTGKITAKKAGTTTVTATIEESVANIRIKVTED